MIELIPAIDLLDGQVVRLKKGDYKEIKQYGAPADVAKSWLDQGATKIHVIDLDGAKDGKLVNVKGLEEILSTGIKVQFGGGIRSWSTLEELFELGVSLAILGTVAIKNQDLLHRALNSYKDRIILALDAKDKQVYIEGWLEKSSIATSELLKELSDAGLKRYIYTNISRDGMLTGPDIEGSVELCKEFPNMKCIVSGGVSSLDDLVNIKRKAQEVNNLEGVIAGKALYENKFTLESALEILR